MSKKLALGMKEELDRCLPDLDRSPSSMFDCSSCEGYTTHPVCLPCGHSLCQLCLEKIQDKEIIKCSICRREYPLVPIGFNGPRRPTLILQNIFDKHCPLLIECRKWRAEGNKFAKNNDFSSAITFYNKALETGVEDHRVYSNRSRAFLAVGDVNSALMDAEKSCSLKPLWTKSHYRRGVALNKLGSHDEAVAAFLLSFHLAGSDQSIFKLLCQVN
jgi:tetratricopeptide (TPR) repeat protein